MNVLVLYAYETVAIILVKNAKVHRAIIVIVTIIITVNRHTLHMLYVDDCFPNACRAVPMIGVSFQFLMKKTR